jgi:hypothetical protein
MAVYSLTSTTGVAFLKETTTKGINGLSHSFINGRQTPRIRLPTLVGQLRNR